ncbi:MAG: DeoR/GlpR transcriptional regulator [Clostridia bacterium]|nr:DeoR/GlpR transcriptional regulator [Clostridia bacterium]
MSITKRQEEILKLLQENRFLTVERLAQLTYTSPSSIRRDLSSLQNLCLVKRTHGGATPTDENLGVPPLGNRMMHNIVGKRIIAKKAAALLSDNKTVMLDGSSTAGFLVPHIAKLKNITLFTNNMFTAISAVNYGINTHCIGGKSVNQSAVLSGEDAYRTVQNIHPDILFFSSQSLDAEGVISDSTEEENYLRSLMLKNACQKIFLCDSEKFARRSLYKLTTLNEIDISVFDKHWQSVDNKCKIL